MFKLWNKYIFSSLILLGSASISFPIQGAEIEMGMDISNYFTSVLAQKDQYHYRSQAYTNKFNSDPYSLSLQKAQDEMTNALTAGVENIIAEAGKKSCSLTKKEVSSVLYYFDSSFNASMDYLFSQTSNQLLKKTPDLDQMTKVCKKYYACYHGNQNALYSAETFCKENFLKWYEAGVTYQENQHSIATAQMGSDKYRNMDVEDSPYDILYDMNAIAKLLFESIQDPVEMNFYYMPNYIGGRQGNDSTSQTNNSDASSEGSGSTPASTDPTTISPSSPGIASPTEDQGNGTATENLILDDELASFLDASKNTDTYNSLATQFGGTICLPFVEQGEGIIEEETIEDNFENISDEEYEKYVEELVEKINDYIQENPSSNKEDSKDSDDPSTQPSTTLPSLTDTEYAIEQIKTCMNSCEGLSFDKRLACQAKCACNQIDSPFFDPVEYEELGLGPFMRIRFCTIPTTSKSFTQRGKTVYSVEEIVNEVLGVLDTLDKSGELGINKKQKELLDTSFSPNFAKQLSFSIDSSVTTKPTIKKLSVSENKLENNDLKKNYQIVKDITDPVLINAYILGNETATMQANTSIQGATNFDKALQQAQDQQQPTSIDSDLEKIYYRNGIVDFHQQIQTYLTQQQNFFLEFGKIIDSLTEKANTLLIKKE